MSNTRETSRYSSPPCFMHELDELNQEEAHQTQAEDRDVSRWRKVERARLIEARLALEPQSRIEHAEAIARHIDDWIGEASNIVLSAYWPFRGEPNLHPWLADFRRRGGRTALPVVVAKGAPLRFREWRQGDRIERGVWNIPIPADGEEVIPDVVIAPLVGFDEAGYRLGYGGGYFDRTLASLASRPKVIGVGYEEVAVKTIYPQWHDIPMDLVVTETGRRSYSR